MAVEQQPKFYPLPTPEDFPVEWESAEDKEMLWRHDRIHFPDPISPLDHDFFSEMLSNGLAKAAETYQAPLVGWKLRRINGYFFQAVLPFEGSPEEASARAERSERAMSESMARVEQLWGDEVLPQVLEMLREWDAFDLTGASPEDFAAHLDETWARARRMWELHFYAIVPAYIGLSEFEELYRSLFEGQGAFDAYGLLQGFDNTTVRSRQRLWELSRKAIGSDDVRAALEASTGADVYDALARSDAGREFAADLRGYLDEFGQRGDTWVLSAPSWIERPSMAVKTLKDLIADADATAPEAATAQAAERREQALAETRERLGGYPRPVVQQFETMLPTAQAGTVVQDDHNFYIDFCGSYRVRRVLLEAERRLVEAGALADPGDVFMLTWQELRESVRDLGIDRRELIRARRAEMERWAAVSPPMAVGSLPATMPPEDPFRRFMMKFYGVPPTPSEEPDTLSGAPGSGGKASGVARVIKSIDEADRLKPGDVLIAETTAPPWTPLFATAAAVVTDTGGILSHCAVVAREYGIPAVVGTAFATKAIEDGQSVEVDGDAGLVRKL